MYQRTPPGSARATGLPSGAPAGLIRSLLLVFGLACSVRGAMFSTVSEPEHTLWIRIKSDPPFVNLYAVPPEGEEPAVLVGTTPCSLAVDFTWGLHWFKKGWQKIRVGSPANTVRAELQPDNSYHIILSVVADKPGCRRKKLERTVARLQDPGRRWEGTILWPRETEVLVTLDPLASPPPPTPPAQRPTDFKRVIRASSGTGEAGTLTVTADVPDADVFVDGDWVGRTPLQVVLPTGPHIVQVQKEGAASVRREVTVHADRELTLRATLGGL